jgi:putative membrane protein
MVECKRKIKSRWVSMMLFMILGMTILISGSAVADSGDHMDGEGMMDWGWWGSSSMLFWMIGYWIIFVIIGILIYKDAENRKMNGLLWFALIILPWIGILFLIIYLIIREEKGSQTHPQKSANTILNERYARGEITREDYFKMKQDMSK